MKLKEFDIFGAPLSGISLVEAGAGTGKTFNIASLFVRAILEKELLPSNILVLTYTEAATAELKTRLRNRIKQSIEVLQGIEAKDTFLEAVAEKFDATRIPHLEEALYKFDEAPISTIHGFCQRLLKEHPIEFGISPEFDILSDDSELLQDKIDEFWRDFFKPSKDEFHRIVQLKVADEGLNPDKLSNYISSALSKRYATIVPEIKSEEYFKKKYQDLKELYNALRETYRREEIAFDKIVKSGVLYKNSLNPEERYFLPEFSEWLCAEQPPLSSYKNLKYFSSYIYERVRKGNEIPEFSFTKLVDQYLEVLADLNDLFVLFINQAIERVSESFEIEKSSREVLSYDDLLQKVEQGLQSNAGGLTRHLRNKYPVALIDEFQDTDPVQYSIFQSIYGKSTETSMFMIGDPKQAIYKFRGADIYTYLRAKKDAHSGQLYKLSSNYRSTKSMIQAVNQVFLNSAQPFMLEDLEFSPAQFPSTKEKGKNRITQKGKIIEPLQFLKLTPVESTAGKVREEVTESVASEIVELLNGDFRIDDKQIQQKDVAILVRTNVQALEMQNVLRDRGIKSVIRNRESVFSSPEADELYLILSAVSDLGYEDGIRAALSTECMDFDASDILNLLDNEHEWNKVFDQFLSLNRLWKSKGFSMMAEELIHNFRIKKNLARHFDAERRITNLDHLTELLRKAEHERKLSPGGLVRYFKNKRSDNSKAKDDEVIRLESDDQLVQIVTVHASKGLEYPVVFCPFLWEGINTDNRLPDSFHRDGDTYMDVNTVGEERIENRMASLTDDLAEAVRLTYVALTRAESACFVHLVKENGFEFSSLSSLAEGFDVVRGRLLDKLSMSNSNFKKTHDSSSFRMVEELTELESHDSIHFRVAKSDRSVLNSDSTSEAEHFSVLTFSRNDLNDYPTVSSFSALSASADTISFEEMKPGFDYDETEQSITSEEDQTPNRFNLKKGAETGTMLHNIFESIQFHDPESISPAVKDQLEWLGLDQEWNDIVSEIITDTVNHDLGRGISLKDLKPKDYFPEIEFHLPTQKISFGELINTIRGRSPEDSGVSAHGFLKGYIDLTFKAGGKYYILDYKSNHLGDSFKDYSVEALTGEVEHASYDLQYHIYTVALHRMLRQSLPDYEYETHFGGVFYVFLRGVQSGVPGSGVFFHKPEAKVISSLDLLFEGREK